LQEKRQPGFEKVQKSSEDRLAYEAVRAAIEPQHPAIKQRIVCECMIYGANACWALIIWGLESIAIEVTARHEVHNLWLHLDYIKKSGHCGENRIESKRLPS
jgi:hypothetical protein